MRPNHIHIIVQIESKKSVGVPLAGTLDQNGMEIGNDHHDRVDDDGTHDEKDNDKKRVPTRGTPMTLGDVVGAFKSITTNEYIHENPKNWASDENNPENIAANKTLHGTSP